MKSPFKNTTESQECRHPLVRKAYYLGIDFRGYIYLSCGKRFSEETIKKPRQARRKE